ncbi:hypothetical protein OF83DRAFT_1170275 [Amylostereum chailletii]|nr:hypothetical protein OF83DRAFT_1170275 [Amylostereum chailletii]
MDEGANVDQASIEGLQTCPFDSFLKAFLSRCQDTTQGITPSPDELLATCLEAVQPICESEGFRGHFTPFPDSQSQETISSSFARASNVTLQNLSTLQGLPLRPISQPEILFHVGNRRQAFFELRNVFPNSFKYRHPDTELARGPDIVITSLNVARAINEVETAEGSKWANVAFGPALVPGTRRLYWSDILGSFTLRPVQYEIVDDRQSNERELLDIQASMIATKLMRRAPCVFHVINATLHENTISVRWFDAQGAIHSPGLNLANDLPRYLVLLLAFQRFTMNDWGLCPELDPNAVNAHKGTERTQNPLEFDVEGISVTVNLADAKTALFKDPNPYGSALKVYSAKSTSTLPATGRSLEIGLLKMKIYWESSDNANHLDPPDTLCSTRLPYSTKAIREDLGLHPCAGFTGPRIMILESLENALQAGPRDDFMKCWFESVHAHYLMQKYAHYPINPSPDKILLRRFQDGSCHVGYTDMDRMVTKAHSDRFEDQHERPNAFPFLAIELLGDYERRTRDALRGESAREAFERMKKTGEADARMKRMRELREAR